MNKTIKFTVIFLIIFLCIINLASSFENESYLKNKKESLKEKENPNQTVKDKDYNYTGWYDLLRRKWKNRKK